MLTDKYPGCKYYYTVAILRAIEESYGVGQGIVYRQRKGKPRRWLKAYTVAYEDGLDIYVKGYLIRHIANPFSIAELCADYSRACLFVGKRPGIRMNHYEIIRAKDFLNGVQSG